MTQLLGEEGWRDIWRQLYPEIPGYTWWSNRGQAYARTWAGALITRLPPRRWRHGRTAPAWGRSFDHAPLIVDYTE